MLTCLFLIIYRFYFLFFPRPNIEGRSSSILLKSSGSYQGIASAMPHLHRITGAFRRCGSLATCQT
jgi:hypothetical protein